MLPCHGYAQIGKFVLNFGRKTAEVRGLCFIVDGEKLTFIEILFIAYFIVYQTEQRQNR